MSKSWYNMTSAKADDGAAEILLYDVIGAWGITAKQFTEDLKSLAGGSITLRINSPGGDVMEGAAIVNVLKSDGRPVTVYIDGIAASMASVVATVGKRVVMPANALMMIHNPWTIAMGDAEKLRKDADLLDKIKNQIVGAYEAKCGDKKKRAEIVAMMDAETWMDGKEAVEAGFADECGETIKAAACAVDVSKFAAKVDARFAALMPATEAKNASATPAVPVNASQPDKPVLLDATVVASRIESERALAFQEGASSRQSEIDGLKAESDKLRGELTSTKAEIEQSHATIAQLKSTVEAEKQARAKAVAAHEAMMGGLRFKPDASDVGPVEAWNLLENEHGYEKARRQFPDVYEAFMRAKVPGVKFRK